MTYSLLQRSGVQTFSVRVRVPKSLQRIIGKPEIVRSTHTSDEREANRRAPSIYLDIQREIDEAKLEALGAENEDEARLELRFRSALDKMGLVNVDLRDPTGKPVVGKARREALACLASTLAGRDYTADREPRPMPIVINGLTGEVTQTRRVEAPAAQKLEKMAQEDEPTLEALLDAHIREARVKEKTAVEYRKGLLDFGAHLRPSQVRRKDVQAFKDQMGQAGKASATIQKRLGAVKIALKRAVDREIIPHSPADKVTVGHKKPVKPRYYNTPEDAARFVPLAKQQLSPHDAFLVELLTYTGLRIEEACSLEVEDIIFRDGMLCINITETKSEAGSRVIPVPQAFAAKLKARVDQVGSGRLLPYQASRYGKYSEAADKRLNRFFEKNEFKFTVHGLRHGFINTLRQNNYRNEHIAAYVGHRTTTITGQYGAHPGLKILKSMVDSTTLIAADAVVPEMV